MPLVVLPFVAGVGVSVAVAAVSTVIDPGLLALTPETAVGEDGMLRVADSELPVLPPGTSVGGDITVAGRVADSGMPELASGISVGDGIVVVGSRVTDSKVLVLTPGLLVGAEEPPSKVVGLPFVNVSVEGVGM